MINDIRDLCGGENLGLCTLLGYKSCRPIDGYQRFGGTYYFHLQVEHLL
jgi:hypothetical protein